MDNSTRYAKLTEFGKRLMGRPALNDGLILISKTAKDLLQADRCSIYIFDKEKNELWTTFADGVNRIRISADDGLAGYTLKEKKPIISNDPYNDVRFLKAIDHKTGYVTRSVATCPVFSSDRRIIGVLQLLNKDSGFDKEDSKFMIFFSHYISSYLELAAMFPEENS